MSDEYQGIGPSGPVPDPIAYNEIAHHFFQEFLELRDQIRSGANPISLSKELQAERAKNVESKRLLQEMASRNEALELTIEDMERQGAELRSRLNQALFEVARLQDLTGNKAQGTGSLFYDRLSDTSKREFDKLMRERPSSNPNRREERE